MASTGTTPGPFPPLDAPVLDWARAWITHGFRPIPLAPRRKKPVHDNWPKINFGEDLPRYFSQSANLGVALGEPYGNTDIDLDCQEAICIWPEFAPPTNMRWGRQGKPNSHWLYRSDPSPRKVAFEDSIEHDGKTRKVTLLEMRGCKTDGTVGFQTMAPPSIHPDTGERVRFEPGADGEPANADLPDLERAVHRCAAATLLVRHFPGEHGGRHDAFLALAGLFQRAGWEEAEATQFARGMYRGLWGVKADFGAAASEVISTYAKAREGGAITDYTRLSELIDEKVLRRALNWLAISAKGTAPPAASEGIAPNFVLTTEGVFFDVGKGQKLLVCRPPLEVLSTAASSKADDWSRVLRWRDVKGNTHIQVVPMEHVGDSNVYRQELKRLGLLLPEKGRGIDLLAQYIAFTVPRRHARLVNRTGWEAPGKIYALPDGAICADSPGADEVLFYAPGMGEHFYRVSGTLTEWQQQVSLVARGNSRLVFALSVSFAGPLLALTDTENGGFHFTGLTSVGKTTTQITAGSVYGGGGIRGFVRTWHATANGLEAMCALHHDGCLMLDEIKQVDPKIAEGVVYNICNAVGKSRMTRQITPRTSLSWRLLFLSSGELNLAEHARNAGPKGASIKGGANVRLINIPADAGKGMGIFEDIHGASDAASFAKQLATNSKKYYGTALPAFLRSLMGDLDAATDWVSEMMDQFTRGRAELAQAAPEVHRAIGRFALVAAAGELATRFGVTGWGQDEPRRAAEACFQAWLKERGGTKSSDLDAAVRQVQAFIEAHGPGRFQPLGVEYNKHGDPIGQRLLNRAGFWTEDHDAREYLVLPECFRNEVCANFDYHAVASELKKRGYLLEGNDSRHPYMKQMRTPDGPHPVWMYHLHSTIWSGPVPPATRPKGNTDVGHDRGAPPADNIDFGHDPGAPLGDNIDFGHDPGAPPEDNRDVGQAGAPPEDNTDFGHDPATPPEGNTDVGHDPAAPLEDNTDVGHDPAAPPEDNTDVGHDPPEDNTDVRHDPDHE
jgi:uncharacterized protein (DUF927 family)